MIKYRKNKPALEIARQVLLVEDNADSRRFHIRLLQNLGYNVDTAENGQHLIAKLDVGHRYGLMLLDIELPDISAIEIATRIRCYKYGRGKSHIVTLITENVSRKTLATCFAAGIGYVVKKPLFPCYFPEILKHPGIEALSWL